MIGAQPYGPDYRVVYPRMVDLADNVADVSVCEIAVVEDRFQSVTSPVQSVIGSR